MSFAVQVTYWFLLVSFDSCCKGAESTYNIRVGRAKQLLGPYLDRDGTPMLEGGGTLILAGYENIRGPGSNSIFVDGTKEYLVDHFYDANDRGLPKLQIRPVVWEDDGWPLVGEPYPSQKMKKQVKQDAAGKWEISVNFADGFKLEALFHMDGRVNNDGAKWRAKGSMLRIVWPDQKAPGGAWIDKCILSPDGTWFVGRNQGGAIIRGKRMDES